MSDEYGAEIAQQGIDISHASDDQKVLDTRWVTLDIIDEPTFSFNGNIATGSTGGSLEFTALALVAYEHNLGFLPAFDYEIVSAVVTPDLPGLDDYDMYADETNIYLVPTIGAEVPTITLNIQINMRIYNLDITTEYEAPVVTGIPTDSNSPSEYGIKFVNPNFAGVDLATAPPEDLNFSTGLRPLNILKHGVITIPTSGFQIIIPYTYDTPPLYVVGSYNPTPILSDTFPRKVLIPNPTVGSLSFSGSRGTVTSDTISITGAQAGLAGSWIYILFKDPLNIKS